jgi:hypothetical protein
MASACIVLRVAVPATATSVMARQGSALVKASFYKG